MIEIIASTKYGNSNKLKKILKERHTKYISDWWYLHGMLEDDMGFDKAIMLDNNYLKYLEFTDKDINKQYKLYYLPDNIYKIKVLQTDKPCTGFFWTTFEKFRNVEGIVPYMHGLVCYSDDQKACEYAFKKYNEKATWI